MKTQRGSFLIEVLISLMLLSIALLGVDSMQMNTLRETKNIYLGTIAMHQLQNIVERLNAKPINLSETIADWNKENAKLLPQGYGVISGSMPHVTITLVWGKSETSCKQHIGTSGCLMLKL